MKLKKKLLRIPEMEKIGSEECHFHHSTDHITKIKTQKKLLEYQYQNYII